MGAMGLFPSIWFSICVDGNLYDRLHFARWCRRSGWLFHPRRKLHHSSNPHLGLGVWALADQQVDFQRLAVPLSGSTMGKSWVTCCPRVLVPQWLMCYRCAAIQHWLRRFTDKYHITKPSQETETVLGLIFFWFVMNKPSPSGLCRRDLQRDDAADPMTASKTSACIMWVGGHQEAISKQASQGLVARRPKSPQSTFPRSSWLALWFSDQQWIRM